MKILLDESVPRLIKLRLPQLDISTVQEMGWAGLRNGSCCDEPKNTSISLPPPIRISGISKTFQDARLLSSCYPATRYLLSPNLCRSLKRCWR